MDEIKFKKNVCLFLGIPSIPLKEWDGKTSFDRGVAIVKRIVGTEDYAICSFDSRSDTSVRIIKDFGKIPFNAIVKIFPVPPYMEDNIKDMDLDESSKEAMEELLNNKKEIIEDGTKKPKEEMYEWGYPFIKDKIEAVAFLKNKNLKGRIPTSDDVLKNKLRVMYYTEKNKKN